MSEPLIYEISSAGRVGALLPDCDVPEAQLPADLLRADLGRFEVTKSAR
ncbi:MAG: hypothetical protein R3E39_27595 [Anaerolineae bacterium]